MLHLKAPKTGWLLFSYYTGQHSLLKLPVKLYMTNSTLPSKVERWFDEYRELGPFLLRLFFAFVLIYGVQDNVFSLERMYEFRDFLDQNGFPRPLASAYLSVYSQFICGILILAGFATRMAAAVMAVNFIIALLMVHIGLPFNANIAPMAMLAAALFFVFYGAPRYSLDSRLAPEKV